MALLGSKQKFASGFEAALVAKWSIIWAVVSDKLGDAFFHGSFETPATAWAYISTEWWTLLITGVFAIIVGGGVRAQGKVNYINAVENGNAPAPVVPVVVPSDAPIITHPKNGS